MKALALVALLALPARAETWLTTRAGNFIVFTNTDAARALHTAEALERMRAVLALSTDLNTRVTDPIRVFVFKTTKDYQHYGEVMLGVRPDKDGLSYIHPFAKAILIDGSALRSDILLQHELTHHFARQTWQRLPLWLDEGLAELYGVTRIRGDVVHLGRQRDLHRRTMRRFPAIPMKDFLDAGERSRWYVEPFLETRFYAQSWLMAHWLIVHRASDIQAISDAFADNPVDVAIAKVFQMTPMQLQRALFRYNQLPGLPSREVRIGALETATPSEPRVMAEAEVESMFTWTIPLPSAVRTIGGVRTENPAHLARYDEAVKKIARGELAEAVRILDELIAELPASELLEDAKKLRAEVMEILRKNRAARTPSS